MTELTTAWEVLPERVGKGIPRHQNQEEQIRRDEHEARAPDQCCQESCQRSNHWNADMINAARNPVKEVIIEMLIWLMLPEIYRRSNQWNADMIDADRNPVKEAIIEMLIWLMLPEILSSKQSLKRWYDWCWQKSYQRSNPLQIALDRLYCL